MDRSEIIKNIDVNEIRKAMDGLEAMALEEGAEGLNTVLDMYEPEIRVDNQNLQFVCVGCWLYRHYFGNTKNGFYSEGVAEFRKRILKKPIPEFIYKIIEEASRNDDIVAELIRRTKLWPMNTHGFSIFSSNIPYTNEGDVTIGEAIKVWRNFADNLEAYEENYK